MTDSITSPTQSELDFNQFRQEVLNDFLLANLSRQMSLIARKEVLGGKAKFGIFGDGKEVPQIAMAKQFRNGDWRSGYYRDQTFMLATGMITPKAFFASLYGETDVFRNPDNGGRSFNNHFGTRLIGKDDHWLNQTDRKNTSSDISPTAGQMPRLVGLALASKLYRQHPELPFAPNHSFQGNEVAFGSIGDGSTSEGHFFETMNAAAVMQIPMAVSVWDDGYAISVPTVKQTVHASVSKALRGFEKGPRDQNGILIYRVKGWDYAGLCQAYEEGIEKCRKEHVPVLFHVEELTQPIGHSTSGSHERYKSAERLLWEKENDCLAKMRAWIIESGIASESECDRIEEEALQTARESQKEAWLEYMSDLERERKELLEIIRLKNCKCSEIRQQAIDVETEKLAHTLTLCRKEIVGTARRVLRHYCSSCSLAGGLKSDLKIWVREYLSRTHEMYSKWLYSESDLSALKVKPIEPVLDETHIVPGREIIRDNFDALLAKDQRLVIIGEDVGHLGGVNQTLEGLQEKYSEWRVRDTGIRETTIIGKAIGLALRGFRPIAEIQYFDYLLYALQTISDDLATTRYRTKNGQQAPVIISTRGHRLEGIWHSGSPMSMVINSIRGVYVCVPRDMTRAAGFYNTLLESNDPALVIEPLNAYRLREKRPLNMGEFKIPLGIPDVISTGTDVTLVTYGSCVRIGLEAVMQLEKIGISVELIDVQTLLPFDVNHSIAKSIQITSRVVFFDEDVPGGATAFMMQKVMEEQNAFQFLDAMPVTVTAKEHRPAYGTDGDYFSNPSAEDVYEAIYGMMSDSDPLRFPPIYE